MIEELVAENSRLQRERDEGQIAFSHLKAHVLQVEKDAKYWEDRALTAESQVIEFEGKEETGRKGTR